MRRNRILFFVTIFTLTLALGAMAQTRGRMAGQGVRGGGQQAIDQGQFGPQFLARYLELTAEQIESWRAIQEVTKAKVAPILESRRANFEAIRGQLDGTPDASTIGRLVIANHALGAEIRVIHEAAQADFVNILTTDQKEKYEKFLELLKSMPRRGGQGLGEGMGAGMGMGFGGGFGPGDGTCPCCED